VVLVAGDADTVQLALDKAVMQKAPLIASDVLIVPLALSRTGVEGEGEEESVPSRVRMEVLEGSAKPELKDVYALQGLQEALFNRLNQPHVLLPQGARQWLEYISSEYVVAKKQGFDPLKQGFSVVLNKNGNVTSRGMGMPSWERFVDEAFLRQKYKLDETTFWTEAKTRDGPD